MIRADETAADAAANALNGIVDVGLDPETIARRQKKGVVATERKHPVHRAAFEDNTLVTAEGWRAASAPQFLEKTELAGYHEL